VTVHESPRRAAAFLFGVLASMNARVWIALLSIVTASVALFAVPAASVAADDPHGAAGQQQAPAADQAPSESRATPDAAETYSSEEIMREASRFFGETSEALAKAIERTFSDYGRPSAYIFGSEGGAAIVVGLRYGEGQLQYKGGG